MKLARSPERTVIFDLNVFEVSNGCKRLQRKIDASELLTTEDIYNQIDMNIGDDWVMVAPSFKHFIAISAPYSILVKVGEHGIELTVDKLFAMQGKVDAPIYVKSNYFEDDNTSVFVRCSIQVS